MSIRTPQRLKHRIACAFAAVLVLHLAVAISGHVGLQKATDDLGGLEQGRRLSRRFAQIDELVRRLQQEVLNYTITGHAAQEDRIRALQTDLLQRLAQALQEAPPGDALALEEMTASLTRYGEHFDDLVRERERRQSRLQQVLSGRGAALASRLADASRGSERPQGDGPEGALTDLRSALDEARIQVLCYLDDLDPADVRRARSTLSRARTNLARLEDQLPAALYDELQGGFAALELDIVDMPLATRSYLRLANVLLAGEAAEFRIASENLRARKEQRLEQLATSIAIRQRDFRRTNLWFSLSTVLVGAIAGLGIQRSVVRPLRAIAQTLVSLAAGNRTEQIPFVEREDEIGAMARAAAVFRERSDETADLLEESRRLAQRHELAIQDLERTNAELDNFANVASHDLKAPLRAISSLTEWIEEDLPQDLPDSVREHLAALRQRTSRMGQLLSDLLVFSRAARTEYELENLDLRLIAEDVWDLIGAPTAFQLELLGRDIHLTAARVPLEQVLANLLSNAVKHHDQCKGRITLEILDCGDEVQLRVRDDGPGIPARYHARVFEIFRTLRPRDDVEASGVGLALVKRHVERAGGTVEILTAEDHRGTTLLVRWPRLACALDGRDSASGISAARTGGRTAA